MKKEIIIAVLFVVAVLGVETSVCLYLQTNRVRKQNAELKRSLSELRQTEESLCDSVEMQPMTVRYAVLMK